MSEIETSLSYELSQLEGILHQNPETGANVGGGLLGQYSTKLFGCPFQLLDSVDRRFSNINSRVGNEFLRNFLLNSPILSIRPGMPHYTGGRDPTSLKNSIKNIYYDTQNGTSLLDSVLDTMASTLIFGSGSKLQRRMFGFRETYYDYMQHVNYMARSCAIFLSLTTGSKFPNGTFMSYDKFEPFSTANWENYRMMNNSTVMTPLENLAHLANVPLSKIKAAGTSIGAGIEIAGQTIGLGIDAFLGQLLPGGNLDADTSTEDALKNIIDVNIDEASSAWAEAEESSFADHLANKVACVQFMVEPGEISESLSNQTEPSMVESAVDAITNSVGSELAWITNSRADIGMLDGLLEFMGDVTTTALTTVSSLMRPVTGGFIDNIFNGAIRSIKGQKMIYPEIYKSSKSTMNYEFDITLTSPYGDIYNYYMNILVPLLHLIALAAPRMVTSNTTTSPYIVQAYIPGMCTCQLGIVEQLSIQKNPDGKHVSVNGFPLTVKIHMVIKELYNALSISPAYDAGSFLFNETLNDYMANLCGLIPSVDTYAEQRKAMFSNLSNYLESGAYMNDVVSPWVERIEDIVNPFY